MKPASLLLALAAVLVASAPVPAQVPMTGSFTAEATCFATVGIREPADNPGLVSVEAGQTYVLIGRNAVPGSHYLIRIPGAEPEQRWVAYGCGRVGEDAGTGAAQAAAPSSPSRQAARSNAAPAGRYVLAASWHAAFCETRPARGECADGGEDEAFTLHGLWPQPRGREYCDVPDRVRRLAESGDWRRLPAPELSRQVQAAVDRVMPGTAAGLDRYEWWKHGTCHEGDADDYYGDSVRLIDALNASVVRDLFVASRGETLTASAIRAAFDEAFGPGAGRRVLVDCAETDSGRLVQELRLELRGALEPGVPLATLLLAAEPVPAGCRAGLVEASG